MAAIRRKLAMGSRVQDFFRAHPSTQPAHVEMLARLDQRLARSDVLALQQRAGAEQERAAVDRRAEIRRTTQQELLPHLVKVGQELGRERPELAGHFRTADGNAPLRTFADVTRAMLALAQANRELFESRGLAQTLLDDLTKAVADFDQTTEHAHQGRRDHVGATADLRDVTREIVGLVVELDRLNRYRFRKDAELRAAWRSARDVAGPFTPGAATSSEGEAPPESPAPLQSESPRVAGQSPAA